MSIFDGIISISNNYTLLFIVFVVLLFGYAFGKISFKGISFGDAGVFIIALLFGGLFFFVNDSGELLFRGSKTPYDFNTGLSIVESLGLIFFVTSIGFIAGPNFFSNFKKNFKSYVLLVFVISLCGGLAAVACIGIGNVIGYGSSITEKEGFVAMISGLYAGSLTSTPAFSAAKATVSPEYQGLVSVGYGIAYIFGVISIVLFVQLIPKITKANIEEEKAKLVVPEVENNRKAFTGKLFNLDSMGLAVFSLAAIIGTFLGNIKIPLTSNGLSGTCFSLTMTGGCLLASLVLGHFGRIGRLNLVPAEKTLKIFRSLGLVLFLVGAGIPGGAEFVANFDIMYFVYGIIMKIIPLFIGYLFAKHVLKFSLFNNLGALTGGMTSTPALGTLINATGTEDVASAYATAYPIALVFVVLVSQFLIILIK